MSTRFTEFIELNQIDINCRIDDVVNKIASDIKYEMTRPYPGTLNYDSKIIAVIEDIDLELRYAEVSVMNDSDIIFEDGKSFEEDTDFALLEDFEDEIRASDRNLYNEKLSYERWKSFEEKLSTFGKVIIICDEDAKYKNNLENLKFAIILNN